MLSKHIECALTLMALVVNLEQAGGLEREMRGYRDVYKLYFFSNTLHIELVEMLFQLIQNGVTKT